MLLAPPTRGLGLSPYFCGLCGKGGGRPAFSREDRDRTVWSLRDVEWSEPQKNVVSSSLSTKENAAPVRPPTGAIKSSLNPL